IIGIIIAAVMSGKGIISSGENKLFYQTFAGKWHTVLSSYYDRMGANLADSNVDGYFDGVDVDESIVTLLKTSGVDPCKIISSNEKLGTKCHPGKYTVEGEFGSSTVTVNLSAYKIADETTINNYLVFKNIPSDVAMAIDKYIDSITNSKEGNCLILGETATFEADNLDAITPLGYSELSTKGVAVNLGVQLEH
ncbi:MAG: hypothetical protein U9Q04_04260, partial [Campylobacterota bacterium]|nr:hypothetical protein [Campylobacterota bacterium]